MAAILTIMLDLADPGREEDLAAALAEERDMAVAPDASAHADLVISDGAPLDDVTPHIMWGGEGTAGGHIRAVLPPGTPAAIVVAAARLAAAGYRVVKGDAGPRDGGLADMLPAERHHLSTREREVLALLAEGAPNKVIARRLGISVHTAKFHVAAIVAKLGAANRTEAIGIAMREGLVLI
jgi:DNA-binding CsgD family transcriptional regulator